jgi:hypothetical protein
MKNIILKNLDIVLPAYVMLGKREGLIFGKGIEFYGAYLDNVIVGFCGIKRMKSLAWLKCDYVFGDYRRRGVLMEMINYRLELLKDYKIIRANCTPKATGAHIKSGAKVIKIYHNGITQVEYSR